MNQTLSTVLGGPGEGLDEIRCGKMTIAYGFSQQKGNYAKNCDISRDKCGASHV